MALPLAYNFESVRARWTAAIVAVLGIAGSVGVFVAMLALANGFRVAVTTSGSPENVMVRRAGATSEIDSAVRLDQLRAIEDAPEVKRGSAGPLVSPEVVVIAALPLMKTGTDANVQVREVTARALEVHDRVRITQGRFFRPGLYELLVGRNATASYRSLGLGDTVRLGGSAFTVVGVFDAGGSAFDSEVWTDADVLIPTYQRPRGIYQSVTARLTSPDALDAMKARLGADPRLHVENTRLLTRTIQARSEEREWQTLDVDLKPFAGRTVTIRLIQRVLLGPELAAGNAYWRNLRLDGLQP